MVVPILLHVLLREAVLEREPELLHQSLPSLMYSLPKRSMATDPSSARKRLTGGHAGSCQPCRNMAKYLVLISILRVVESGALRIEAHLSARVFLTTRAVQ